MGIDAASKHTIVRRSLGKIYTKPSYYVITGFTAVAVLAFYTYLTNVPLINYAFRSGYPLSSIATIMASLIGGIGKSSGLATASTIVLSAVLVGINVSLLVYRARNIGLRARDGSSGFGGFLVGAFGAGCPACATGLLSLLGVTGGLAVLPFNGWELRLLSFVLLVLPIYWLSRDIENNGACEIR